MKKRCCNPGHNSYARYGGRGIKICVEWMNDLNAFITWATTHGFRRGLQIDRIDNDGDYEPENCRWVSAAENQHNSSNAKLSVEKVRDIREAFASGAATQPELARIYRVDQSTISVAINGKTWSETH